MKASDSSERYVGKVRECCNYAARSAKNFIAGDKATHRQPCGENEKELADTLKTDLTKFCDTVSEDTFTASQKAYVFSNLLMFIFLLIAGVSAILAYFFNELILIGTIFFAGLALFAYFGAFGGTSKKTSGENIFATRTCNAEVKNRIIIEANLDAPYKRKISPKAERVLKALNFFFIIFDLAFAVVDLLITYYHLEFFASEVFMYIGFILPLFAIVPAVLSRSVIANASTLGVVDNLIGCYTACGAVRYMSEMDLRLHHTELCVLLTGARNAKFAGAKEYCKLHAEEDKSVDTTIISLNSIYNADSLTSITDAKKAKALITDASANAESPLVDSNPKYLKSSAKIFKKAGIPAVTLTSLPDTAPAFYGTASDNADNINVKAIEASIKIILEAAYLKDSK